MATFAKSTFSHASYASFRPSYPPILFKTIYAYHQGPKSLCVDLGCGHGNVARDVSSSFARVIGTDPSVGMLVQARSITAASPSLTNIEFRQCGAENIPFLGDGSVDMVVSGQAAHWFDYPTFFPEMRRILRAGGTLALWGYKDHVFVDYPKATDILNKYAYGADSHMLGSYWQQPGRSVVQNKYRDIIPPADEWEAVQRIEYEPRAEGKRSGEGTLFLEMRMRVRDCMNYIRTWSSYHAWKEAHPGMEKKENGGEGDIVDQMFEEIRGAEEGLGGEGWEEKELDMEWGSGLLLARRT